jgi:phosphonate transport system substrate-binding protein
MLRIHHLFNKLTRFMPKAASSSGCFSIKALLGRCTLCIFFLILQHSHVQASSGTSEHETLRFGRVGVEDPTVTLSKYQPLISKLGDVLEKRVELVQTATYMEMQNLFISGRVHLGILNAFSYVLMGREARLLPVAKRMVGTDGYYRCYIIANRNLDVTGIADLKGRTFAFSEQTSTTGYLLPMLLLREHGINPETDFSKTISIYQHDSIILAVANWSVDIASVASYVFDGYDKRITNKIKIIEKSAPIPLGPLVVRNDLGMELIDKIRNFFLTLHQSETGQSLLKEAGLSRFAPVADGEYDAIREAAARFDKEVPSK